MSLPKAFVKKITGYFRILPLLVLVAMLAFSVRLGDFMTAMEGRTGTAYAQQEVNTAVPPLPEQGMAPDGLNDAGRADAVTVPPLEDPAQGDGQTLDWQDASEAAFEFSEVRAELAGDLRQRRQELEERERSLAMREAILEAAGRELDQKMQELVKIRSEIEALLATQSEEQDARIQSLVRIYEGMRAKEAARIFNTLDIDVLISVMSRMSERRSAPILAEMSAERARTVTRLLAQQHHLPTLPQ